jgi:UDP-glucose:(heptosyl)LPS alpha-1,3-glucosyltransferase
LGSLKDISPVYSAADMLVHPTLEDTFGMVVLEAMAHGLPVIVSNQKYCGISALLADRSNAMLLNDPEDVAELGEVLNGLVRDVALQQQLGQAAITFARLHDWPAIAAQQDIIYQSVCESVA